MSAYGAAVGAPARARADEIKAAMVKGGYVIFKGGLKDNKGNVVVAKNLDQFDAELEKMNYLVEGVLGSIPG
jgi:basic membrane protein A and related proteins